MSTITQEQEDFERARRNLETRRKRETRGSLETTACRCDRCFIPDIKHIINMMSMTQTEAACNRYCRAIEQANANLVRDVANTIATTYNLTRDTPGHSTKTRITNNRDTTATIDIEERKDNTNRAQQPIDDTIKGPCKESVIAWLQAHPATTTIAQPRTITLSSCWSLDKPEKHPTRPLREHTNTETTHKWIQEWEDIGHKILDSRLDTDAIENANRTGHALENKILKALLPFQEPNFFEVNSAMATKKLANKEEEWHKMKQNQTTGTWWRPRTTP